jgi:hypothetical protein
MCGLTEAQNIFYWFIPFISLCGVRLSPLGTSATNWPIVPAPMIDDECGAVYGMRVGRGNRSTRRKPAQVPLCPPRIPHDLTWARTRADAVGIRPLTAWAMAQPTEYITQWFVLPVFINTNQTERTIPFSSSRSYRVLAMVYNTQNYCFGLCPLSGILKNTKEYYVSETESVSVFRWRGGRHLLRGVR